MDLLRSERSVKIWILYSVKQGSRSARLSPQSMTWDECKVYKNGVGAQYVQWQWLYDELSAQGYTSLPKPDKVESGQMVLK